MPPATAPNAASPSIGVCSTSCSSNRHSDVGEVEHSRDRLSGCSRRLLADRRHLGQGAGHSCGELPAPRQPYTRDGPGPAQRG